MAGSATAICMTGPAIGVSVENLLNTHWKESQFEELSRLKYECKPVDEMSYTPGTPFFARLKFTLLF